MLPDSMPPSPQGSASTPPPRATPKPGWVEEWYECQRKEEERVLAELREKIGPDGDLKAAYREWYAEQRREHDEGMMRIAERLHRFAKEQHELGPDRQ
jgi:hypothetical protein